mgnify:CR=1 FL=1
MPNSARSVFFISDGTGITAEMLGHSLLTQFDEVRFNEAAAKLMAENGIEIDDLHAIAAANASLQRPQNVHFTDPGYDVLADAVAASIEKALAPEPKK